MSFNRAFNSKNKFILGPTNFKALPSTGGPTVGLNNDNALVISSDHLEQEPGRIHGDGKVLNNNEVDVDAGPSSSAVLLNDNLINLLENIGHSPNEASDKISTPDEQQIDKLMKESNGAESSSSSDGEGDSADLDEKTASEELKLAEIAPLESSSDLVVLLAEAKDKLESTKGGDSDETGNLIDVDQQEETEESQEVQKDTQKDTEEPQEPEKPQETTKNPEIDTNEPPHPPVKQHYHDHNQDLSLPFDFQTFLKQLKSPNCSPIIKYIKSFLKQFSLRNWTVEEQAKLTKDFQSFILTKFTESVDVAPAELTNVKEGFEKLVMSRLYTQVFPPLLVNSPKLTKSHKEELLQDLKLLENLLRFQWIEARHLDLPESMMSNSKSFIELSSNELNKLNNYKSPRDKIICILNCCKVIYGLIRKQNSKGLAANSNLQENADSFVPLLIMIILKSRPKHLICNINYIERFRNEAFLNGEAMYYLSSLQLLSNFIVKVDHKLLTIEEEEFNENVARVELELRLKKEARDAKKSIISPVPLLAGKLQGDRYQDLSPSQILATSANAISQKLNQIFAPDEEDPEEQDQDLVSKVKKLSIKEHEEQMNSYKKEAEVFDNLKSIFPNIDDEILKDIIVMKNYNIGDCIESCLELLA